MAEESHKPGKWNAMVLKNLKNYKEDNEDLWRELPSDQRLKTIQEDVDLAYKQAICFWQGLDYEYDCFFPALHDFIDVLRRIRLWPTATSKENTLHQFFERDPKYSIIFPGDVQDDLVSLVSDIGYLEGAAEYFSDARTRKMAINLLVFWPNAPVSWRDLEGSPISILRELSADIHAIFCRCLYSDLGQARLGHHIPKDALVNYLPIFYARLHKIQQKKPEMHRFWGEIRLTVLPVISDEDCAFFKGAVRRFEILRSQAEGIDPPEEGTDGKLILDLNNRVVTIGKRQMSPPLTEDQSRVLCIVIEANGGIVSGEDLKKHGMKKERPDKIIRAINQIIHQRIGTRTGSGGGYWIKGEAVIIGAQ